ncbi:VWA domain-containing protein [Kineobactrum salinum]|uniref:VWA domain-containing protein n=1 Tax=Kineobactrum salinum TaxID=2708301 RepID=A0A6C0U8F9_9GAMM|nr:vWA domain-containing protein [Kineobactrum salinum]QIB67337.1 VWA domain-containing protein [Kineobactrum salinum]
MPLRAFRVDRFSALFAAALLLCGLLAGKAVADVSAGGPRPDLRLLIDISGSMKQSDPDNLRGPALELIVRLLPEGSRAGVWIFGDSVKQIVPHREIDAAWREQALEAVGAIDNSGQRTNIPAALAAAVYDRGSMDSTYRTSIVLLTDGKVDVSSSPMANAAAARELLTETAPELAATGIPVHTIALSDEADWTFLSALAETTAGLAEKAQNAARLTEIFVQSLEMVAPTARVPVVGNIFLIDDTVDEFTALVFYEQPETAVTLASPSGKVYAPGQNRPGADWFTSRQFALVTVAAPERGAWTLQAPDSARARVSVISDLRLEVDPLPNSLPAGRTTELGIRLRESGQVISSAELLELFAISVTITGPEGYTTEIDVSGSYPPPDTGEYRVAIPAFEIGGRYQLLVKLNGKTLQRELPMYMEVIAAQTRPSISTRSMEVPEENLLRPALTVVAVFLVATLAILWTVRRRRLRRLELWKQRFQSTDEEPDDRAVAGMRAEPGEEQDRKSP